MSNKKKLKPSADLIARIATIVEASGANPELVAQGEGVSPETWERWWERAQTARSGIFKVLHDEIERAKARAEVGMHVGARKAAVKNPGAAVKLLELLQAGKMSNTDAITDMLRRSARLKGIDPRIEAICSRCRREKPCRCEEHGRVIDITPMVRTPLALPVGEEEIAEVVNIEEKSGS